MPFCNRLAIDQSAIQLSPIFFGVLLTLFILSAYCLVRILFNRSHQKGDNVIENAKQSTGLLCGGGGSASGSENGVNSNGNNVNRTDTLTKVCCHINAPSTSLSNFFPIPLLCRILIQFEAENGKSLMKK